MSPWVEDRRQFADYEHGTLPNGRVNRVNCAGKRTINWPQPPQPPKPNDLLLRLLAAPFGYAGWTNLRTGATIVTVPFQNPFVPLFTARMKATAMTAMNSIDAPLGNVTLVGKIKGRLTVVTLEVGY